MTLTHDGPRAWPCSLLLMAILSTSGCTGASLASSHFAPQFDCASARLAESPGGYRLEGCGQIAFYHCGLVRDGYARPQQSLPAVQRLPVVYWTPQSAPEAGQFRATREGVDQSTTSSNCMFESQRAMSQAESNAALARLTWSPAVQETTHRADGAEVKAKVAFQGGHLELLSPAGAPSDYLLLSVHSKQAVQVDDRCRMTSFVDGTSLTIQAVRQRSAHEVQLVVPAKELRGLEGSVRFFGSVCGLRFDLDERARHTLAKFELAMR